MQALLCYWRGVCHPAAAAPLPSPPAQRPQLKENGQEFKCEQCDYTSTSKQGVSVHKGHKHKELQKPEILRGELVDKSLDLSHVSRSLSTTS